jgi:DNA-binding transcriptional ArsR family regulator
VTDVRFSANDVARTRFSATPAPLQEAALALAALRRADLNRADGQHASSPHRQRLLAQARHAFPDSARPLLDLFPTSGLWPEFLDPLVADLDEALELIRALPRHLLRADLAWYWQRQATAAQPPAWLRQLADGDTQARELVVRALRDFYLACIAPLWPEVIAAFRTDIATRTPLLAAGGPIALLSSLDPQLTWTGNGLSRSTGTATMLLDGTGMQLVPSVFWAGPPLFSVRSAPWGGNALLYPAAPALSGISPHTGAGNAADHAVSCGTLDRLLGRTRAAALRAVQQPCSTTELAARLQASASSASEHARALRDAGLINTNRNGQAVCHSLTLLGHNLLNHS